MKKNVTDIKTYQLDSALYRLHKDAAVQSDFGLDNSDELIDGGFGLYSSANVKAHIGPIKTQYYRASLVRAGSVKMDLGIETYRPGRDHIVFGFPGQVFSLYDKSDDFVVYYMLFREDFLPEALPLNEKRGQYPFFSYAGIQSFQLEPEVAADLENLIFSINEEIKNRRHDSAQMIRLYLQLILAQANRSYEAQRLGKEETATSGNALFRRFVKLVGQHFLTLRRVSDYAKLLNISADHLNRTIKNHSEKTAGELIDAMILAEAKAYLLHTELSNAEIAYQLDFADPSHFNKFFKKLTQRTPVEFRDGV